jgi:hypothetical protein
MFGMGITNIIIGLVVLVLVFAASKQGRGGWSPGPALVLKKFSINKAATGQKALIDIVGRQGGLISWFLTLIGLDTISSLKVTSTNVSLKDSSLFGQQSSVIAISSISSVHCGYRKPLSYFFISVICLLMGLGSAISQDSFKDSFLSLIGGLFFAAIFFVLYFLKKTLVIYLWPRAGAPVMGLPFKRSVIENVDVDIEQAELAIEIINSLVIKAQNITKVTSEDVIKDADKNVTESKSSAPKNCANCGSELEEGSIFCTSCGKSI